MEYTISGEETNKQERKGMMDFVSTPTNKRMREKRNMYDQHKCNIYYNNADLYEDMTNLLFNIEWWQEKKKENSQPRVSSSFSLRLWAPGRSYVSRIKPMGNGGGGVRRIGKSFYCHKPPFSTWPR